MTRFGKSLLLLSSFLLYGLRTASAQQAAPTPAVAQSISVLKPLPPVVPAALRPHLTVEWREGKLTVSAERAPLASVLLSLMRRTGIEIHGLDKVDEEVSVQFAGVKLTDALENLLARTDYVLENSRVPNGTTRLRVRILGERHGPGKVTEVGALQAKQADGTQDNSPAETAAHRANLEEVRKALDDSDPVVRSAALAALSEENPQAVSEVMADLPESRKAGMRRLQALQQMAQDNRSDGQTVLSALGDALKDSDPAVQAFAVQGLTDRGDPESMEFLRNAFHALDPANRMLAVETAVQKSGGQQILQDAMQDPDRSIRFAAAELLKQFGQSNGGNNPDAN
jgi:hypothetical protein